MKPITTLLLIVFTLYTYAQNNPKWIESGYRTSKYPADTYLQGFAHDLKLKDETLSEATERIKNLASGNLAKSIITEIHTISKNYTQSIEYKGNEDLKQTFEAETKSESNAKINGIKIEEFYNSKTHELFAFAYANKYEVIGYYKANVNMHIQQIEGIITIAENLISSAEKFKAKQEYIKTIPYFAKIEYAQGLLSALDKNSTNESLLIDKAINLRTQVVNALADLEQGIMVFIQCDASLFGENIQLLESKIKSQLAQNGCSFVPKVNKADWIVEINAEASKANETHGFYISYVNATVKLKKAHNNQHVFEDAIKQKGTSGKGYTDAAKKGFENIAKQISERILKWINT
jgi:hypothetical protein